MTIKYLDSKRISALSSDALVAHLKFNDNVTDSAGSNNGTVTGTTTYVAGKINNAFSFNGSSYITLDNESNFDIDYNEPFSIAFWYKTNNTSYNAIYGKGNNTSPYSGIQIGIYLGKIQIDQGSAYPSSYFTKDQSTAVTANVWHHAVMTLSGSGTNTGCKLYVDGSIVPMNTASPDNQSASILNNISPRIGYDGNNYYNTGLLDDVRIYSREIDQSEVTMIYNSGNGTEENKPTNVQDNSILVEKDTGKRYWFDEATPTTFEDDFDYATQTLADSSWVPVNTATKCRVNVTTDKLGFAFDNDTSQRAYHDLGAGNVSDDSWVLRFKINFSTLTRATGNSRMWVKIGTGTGDMNEANAIGIEFEQTNNYGNHLRIAYSANSLVGDIVYTLASSTDYYIQVTRLTSTTAKIDIFSDSGYSTSLGSANGTISANTGLQYIKLLSNTTSTQGNFTGTVDDLEFYNGVTSVTPATWTWSNDKTRGVFGGGSRIGDVNTMDYIIIATLGNAVDFGDLTVARRALDGVSSDVRGVFGGGENGSRLNVMDYITIATAGNATDFGDLTVARRNVGGVSSDAGRGVFGGGYGSTYENTMDYITIATTGNATDFGNLTVARTSPSGCNSDVRGVISGGNGSNVMDYITIATTGNATDFGDLSTASGATASVDSDVRGVIQNGNANNVIDYITIATAGNATDFGDSLQVSHGQAAGVSGTTRGVFGGGYNTSNVSQNYIEYVTIATLGNAIDFGDLSQARAVLAGVQS